MDGISLAIFIFVSICLFFSLIIILSLDFYFRHNDKHQNYVSKFNIHLKRKLYDTLIEHNIDPGTVGNSNLKEDNFITDNNIPVNSGSMFYSYKNIKETYMMINLPFDFE